MFKKHHMQSLICTDTLVSLCPVIFSIHCYQINPLKIFLTSYSCGSKFINYIPMASCYMLPSSSHLQSTWPFYLPSLLSTHLFIKVFVVCFLRQKWCCSLVCSRIILNLSQAGLSAQNWMNMKVLISWYWELKCKPGWPWIAITFLPLPPASWQAWATTPAQRWYLCTFSR